MVADDGFVGNDVVNLQKAFSKLTVVTPNFNILFQVS